MAKRTDWPHCEQDGCGRKVREVPGSYAGKRLWQPDLRCATHALDDRTFEDVRPEPAAPPTPVERAEIEFAPVEPVSSERISSLREALREGVLNEHVAGLLQETLLEALSATRGVWTTCPNCSHRVPVQLPDLGTRVSAVRALLDQVDGKLQEVREGAEEALHRDAMAMLKRRGELSDEDLAVAIATLEQELAADD